MVATRWKLAYTEVGLISLEITKLVAHSLRWDVAFIQVNSSGWRNVRFPVAVLLRAYLITACTKTLATSTIPAYSIIYTSLTRLNCCRYFRSRRVNLSSSHVDIPFYDMIPEPLLYDTHPITSRSFPWCWNNGTCTNSKILLSAAFLSASWMWCSATCHMYHYGERELCDRAELGEVVLHLYSAMAHHHHHH